MTYVTKQGDMWDSIAFNVMGDCRFTDSLINANLTYRQIYIFTAGVVLVIPEVHDAPVSSLPPWKMNASAENSGVGSSAASGTTDAPDLAAVVKMVSELRKELLNKQDSIKASGILKGDGSGGVYAATPGTDYQTPITIDSTPTQGSSNAVSSGGVHAVIGTVEQQLAALR